jgi:hypothetical protein
MKVYLAPDDAEDFVLPVSKKELRWLPAVRGALAAHDTLWIEPRSDAVADPAPLVKPQSQPHVRGQSFNIERFPEENLR